MDFSFGEKSDAFRDEVREFLRENFRPDMIERVDDTGTGILGIYRLLGANGWIAASWPEEYGGQGRDPFEMTAMRDELRLVGVPTDGLGQSIMVARTILAVGSEEQKQTFLPPFLAGEIIFGLGYTEPDSDRTSPPPRHAECPTGRRRLDHRRPEDVHHVGARGRVRLPARGLIRGTEAPRPHHVPGSARRARSGDPSGAHDGRRTHQRHLLHGRPGARCVPGRWG